MTRAARPAAHQPLGGYFFCLTCQAPAEFDDPGSVFPSCIRGGRPHRTIEWRHYEEPVVTPRAPRLEVVPADAAPAESKRHLPTALRYTLTQMACAGYLRCEQCDEPTRKNAEDCCVLCGSSRVVFIEPTVKEIAT